MAYQGESHFETRQREKKEKSASRLPGKSRYTVVETRVHAFNQSITRGRDRTCAGLCRNRGSVVPVVDLE